MFRRSPLLGAAVVYGVSRSAARREHERQEIRQSQREWEMQQALDRDRRQSEKAAREEERRREDERRREMATMRATPLQQPVMMPPHAVMQPAMMSPPYNGAPTTANAMFCPACGNAVRMGDRFCNMCGTVLAAPGGGQPATGQGQ
jgi:hypothetical protein